MLLHRFERSAKGFSGKRKQEFCKVIKHRWSLKPAEYQQLMFARHFCPNKGK